MLVGEGRELPPAQKAVVCQIVDGREDNVVADGLVYDDGLVVTVLRGVGDGMPDGSGDVVDLSPVGEGDGAGAVPGGGEDRLADLVHAALGQAAEAEDLALVEVEGDVADLAGDVHVPDGEHNLVGDRLAVVGAVVGRANLAADHETLEIVLGHVLRLDGADVLAVAQDGDGVGMGQDLIQVVADEDDGAAIGPDGVHDLVELKTAVLGQGGGGLVDDQDLGLHVGALDDLDQLAVLEVVMVDHVAGLNAAEAVLVQQALGLLVHGAGVLDAHMHEGLLMAEEDVLRDGEAGEGAHLLYDDGHALVVGLDLVAAVQFLPVKGEGAAADGVDAAEHLGEGGLAGAVLADQGADLAGVDGEGDVVDGVGDAEALVNVFRDKKNSAGGSGAALLAEIYFVFHIRHLTLPRCPWRRGRSGRRWPEAQHP